jgi:hypothetical protein
MTKKAGRPSTSKTQKDNFVRKLEPYLKYGVSLNKACAMSGVPSSTVYDLKRKDSEFSEIIDLMRGGFFEITVNDLILVELKRIEDLQSNGLISKDDRKFLQWIAEKHIKLKKNYGDAKNLTEDNQIEFTEKDNQLIMKTYEIVRKKMIEENGGELPWFLDELNAK